MTDEPDEHGNNVTGSDADPGRAQTPEIDRCHNRELSERDKFESAERIAGGTVDDLAALMDAWIAEAVADAAEDVDGEEACAATRAPVSDVSVIGPEGDALVAFLALYLARHPNGLILLRKLNAAFRKSHPGGRVPKTRSQEARP